MMWKHKFHFTVMGTICNRHTTDFTLTLPKSSSNRIANLCSYIVWLLEVLNYLQKYSFGFPISSCKKAPCIHLVNIAISIPLYTMHTVRATQYICVECPTVAVGNIGISNHGNLWIHYPINNKTKDERFACQLLCDAALTDTKWGLIVEQHLESALNVKCTD